MVFLRRRWKQKPKQWGPFSVARSLMRDMFEYYYNISYAALYDAWPCWERSGGILYNYGMSGRQASLTNMDWDADLLVGNASSDRVTASSMGGISSVGFFFDFILGATIAQGGVLNGYYTSSSDRIYFRINSPTSFYIYGNNPSIAASITIPYSLVVGTRYRFYWQLDGSTCALWIDGDYIGSVAVSATISSMTNRTYYFDSRGLNDDSNYYGAHSYYQHLIFSELLNDDQISRLSQNPWLAWQSPSLSMSWVSQDSEEPNNLINIINASKPTRILQ